MTDTLEEHLEFRVSEDLLNIHTLWLEAITSKNYERAAYLGNDLEFMARYLSDMTHSLNEGRRHANLETPPKLDSDPSVPPEKRNCG